MQEFDEVVPPRCVAHEQALGRQAFAISGGQCQVGEAFHLKDVSDGVLNHAALNAVESFDVHQDYHVRLSVQQLPAEAVGNDEESDRTSFEHALHQGDLRLAEPVMDHANAVLEASLRALLGELGDHSRVEQLGVLELLRLLIARRESDKVKCCDAGLFAVAHEDDGSSLLRFIVAVLDLLSCEVLLHMVESGLGHG